MAKLVQSLALLLCLQRISELVIWRAVDLVRPVHLVTALDPLLTVCHPASAARHHRPLCSSLVHPDIWRLCCHHRTLRPHVARQSLYDEHSGEVLDS
jgi:hypothetical protein